MSQATEQIARQFANGSVNKIIWGNLIYNVKVYGAKADGITDDTAAIQNAITAAAAAGGGVVYCPPTTKGYLINGALTLSSNVHLTGAFFMQGDKYNWNMKDIQGTTFIIKANSGATTGPNPITMLNNSTISNIKFFYPNQVTNNAVISYPATIRLYPSAGNDCNIENVFLVNSYIGVDATGSHERLTVKNLRGQPLFGIKIDNCLDVDRLEDIHLYPYYGGDPSQTTSYSGNCLYNGIAIDIQRCDNIQLSNVFVYGYKYGVYLHRGANGNSYGTMVNCGFDYCWKSIYAEDQGVNGNGWYVSNCTFIAGDYARGVSAVGVALSGTDNNGGFHLDNCGFWTGNNGQMDLFVEAGQVNVSNCRFNSWAQQAIYVSKVSAVTVTGSTFVQTGNHVVYDASATKGVVMVGSRFNGGYTKYNPGNLVEQLAANTTL